MGVFAQPIRRVQPPASSAFAQRTQKTLAETRSGTEYPSGDRLDDAASGHSKHDFGRVRVDVDGLCHPRGSQGHATAIFGAGSSGLHRDAARTVVEQGDQSAEQPEALKRRMEEPPSEPQNLLVRPSATISSGPSAAAEPPQPITLGMLRHVANRGGPWVTGPPVGKDLATISAGGGAGAAGYTDWPSGFKAPDFDFNTATGAGAGSRSGLNWTASPTQKIAASEGTSGSFYTSAGKQKTAQKEGGKDVYWNFSAPVSSIVKDGEQEHCDDFAEAYKISLQEAEAVLKANVVGKAFGPAASASDAEKLVLKAIDDNLTHKALGSDKTKWSATYTTLYQKTLTRDTSAWHTMSTGARTESAADVTYEIVKGSSQIGSHSSASIIKY
jgi:hypothetical protein